MKETPYIENTGFGGYVAVVKLTFAIEHRRDSIAVYVFHGAPADQLWWLARPAVAVFQIGDGQARFRADDFINSFCGVGAAHVHFPVWGWDENHRPVILEYPA